LLFKFNIPIHGKYQLKNNKWENKRIFSIFYHLITQ